MGEMRYTLLDRIMGVRKMTTVSGSGASLGVTKVVQLNGETLLIAEVLGGDSVAEGEYVVKSITVTKKNASQGSVSPQDNNCIIQFNSGR